jgi:hypothetical protein
MLELERKQLALKKAVENLREAQDDLRLRRAEYNKAVSDLIGEGD